MFRFKLFILFLVIFFSSFQPAFANICEEDAAKIAMSHCFKNFSDLYESPSVKIRVEKVELVKLNGINGPVELYCVVISKYHRQTLIKINDFLSYEIERYNAVITAIKNIENDHTSLKARSYKLFSESEISASKAVDYEKYANVINLCGELILSGIKDEKQADVKMRVFSNLDTILAGIGEYKPQLSHKTAEFETGLKSLKLLE